MVSTIDAAARYLQFRPGLPHGKDPARRELCVTALERLQDPARRQELPAFLSGQGRPLQPETPCSFPGRGQQG